MFDYKLKFENEQQANEVLSQYEQDIHNVAIVKIGTLYDHIETDQKDEFDMPIYEPVALDGYHVDVRSRYEIDFGDYVVVPKSPKHVIG